MRVEAWFAIAAAFSNVPTVLEKAVIVIAHLGRLSASPWNT